MLDPKRYAFVDDKVATVSWVKTHGDVTKVKFRPRLPGSDRWEPSVVAEMRLIGADRIDVCLARLPRNVLNHLLGSYRASYTYRPVNGKTLVMRTVSYRFRGGVSRLAGQGIKDRLELSLHRELAGAKAVLEGHARRHAQVIIVGAGLSGIAAAVKLRDAGITDVLVIEKSASVGGTWRDNIYPGCGVDIPSAVYSFSFAPNPDWSRLFVGQQEILDYIDRSVSEYALERLIHTRTEMLGAAWQADHRRWLINTNRGDFTADHVIFATGLLHEPRLPDVPGLDDFHGEVIHSARWDPSVDLSGKRVAVVGTGCSAIQIVPAIQPTANRVYVFQRTAPWVFPRPDLAVPVILRRVFRKSPWTLGVVRKLFTAALNAMAFLMRDVRRARLLNPVAHWMLRRQVRDARLRAKVTPRFTVGCKRLIMSNDYYPALGRDNVELIPHALTEVRDGQAIDACGGARPVDVIVLASGFQLRRPPIAGRIRGRDGRLLSEMWSAESPRAYLGTTVPNVPNGYFLLGPNVVMYNSLLTLAEWQISYIIGAINSVHINGFDVLEVKPETCEDFNQDLERASANSTYNRGGCSNFYLDEKGRNFVTYPWRAARLRRSLHHFDIHNYWSPPGDGCAPPATASRTPYV